MSGRTRSRRSTYCAPPTGLDPGADLGWDRLEGNEPFADPGPTDGWPDDDAPLVAPLFTYDHAQGCSISGGFVYRGSASHSIDGDYLFTDYCTATFEL